MPFSDNDSENEDEARAGADEDWEITPAGRKVVHNTSVNADTKLYAYLPPEEAELDAEQIEKVLVPALLMQMRQQDTNYFATNPLQISGTYEARVGVDDTQVRTAVVVAHEQPEVMAALAAIAAGVALNVLGIQLTFQNIIAFRAIAATLEGRSTRVRHNRRPAIMMTLKATGITSNTEADAFLDELCRASGGEVQSFFLMERRGQQGSMMLDGSLRIWFCPAGDRQFVWPDECVVKLQESGVTRPVTLNRFSNVAVHDENYKICCGAIGNCTADCTKRKRTVKPKKTGLRAPKHLPPAVQAAKEIFAQAILTACAPHIIGGKIGGIACKRVMCHEFRTNAKGKGPGFGHSKLMLPGMACGEKCTAFPCVAKRAGASFPACLAAINEFNSLAAVQAWRSQPGPPETAGAPEAAGAGEGGTAEAAAGESSGMQVG